VRSLFNFNPLLKLDGYYLLSDLTSTPNLRQRAWDTFWSHVRWVLWGAARPQREPKRAFLLCFGAAVWVYAMSFLLALAIGVIWWFGDSWGPLGTLAACALALWVLAKQFDGFSKGEVMTMLRKRPIRLAALTLGVVAISAVMVLVMSWVLLRGAAMANRRIRLAADQPMQAVWDAIGNCGTPPKNQSRKFAVVGIVLSVAAWIVLPIVIGIALAT